MDNRGIINLRAWMSGEKDPVRWDTFSDRPAGIELGSIPQEGTGLRCSDGREIFRGDIVAMGGGLFLVCYNKGAYRLEVLEHADGAGDGGMDGVWLHDVDMASIEITGSSIQNSDFVVQCLNRNLRKRHPSRE